jgi:hypothetical protein
MSYITTEMGDDAILDLTPFSPFYILGEQIEDEKHTVVSTSPQKTGRNI